jgi:membrane protease YdiL (CAAX protease family)
MILALYASIFGKDIFRDDQELNLEVILKGLLSGGILYTTFYFGYNILEQYIIHGSKAVYMLSSDSSLFTIATALVITSICEEYFWRRYIQTTLIKNHGIVIGLMGSTVAYALIHIMTLNIPLVFAAFLAGFFWGVLYEHSYSIWVITLSHIVWTELIFVFLPLN